MSHEVQYNVSAMASAIFRRHLSASDFCHATDTSESSAQAEATLKQVMRDACDEALISAPHVTKRLKLRACFSSTDSPTHV